MCKCPYWLQKHGIYNLIISKIYKYQKRNNLIQWIHHLEKFTNVNKVPYNQSNIIQVYFRLYCMYKSA